MREGLETSFIKALYSLVVESNAAASETVKVQKRDKSLMKTSSVQNCAWMKECKSGKYQKGFKFEELEVSW